MMIAIYILGSLFLYTIFGGAVLTYFKAKREKWDEWDIFLVILFWPFVFFHYLGVGLMNIILSKSSGQGFPKAKIKK